MKQAVRVRFAPSPTGLMHLGNIRTALMNYLFAKHHDGTFILRIEDTDPERNFDPGGQIIMKDLDWLGLHIDEGPNTNEKFGPYLQSERVAIYEQHLNILKDKQLIYRCFCTTEELDKKRQRQIALKRPPRYDRTCLKLSDQKIKENIDGSMPFIWRMKLNHDDIIIISDIGHGSIKFEMHNFSDFPITRQNGTVTFMFANFVDDMVMQMTHILRGEDHLSNTAGQAALYKAFEKKLPTFWHLPILCNAEGKKLSKRDFGFSLHDLQDAGFLPEALCNYLGIIGGGSFEQEIMSLEELARALNFEKHGSAGQVRYDVEKLKWVNHKWIDRLPTQELAKRILPFIAQDYPQANELNTEKLERIVDIMKVEITTLTDAPFVLAFIFEEPDLDQDELTTYIDVEYLPLINMFVKDHFDLVSDAQTFVQKMKEFAKKNQIPLKCMFWFLRIALMGTKSGPSIPELVEMLGAQETKNRLERALVE